MDTLVFGNIKEFSYAEKEALRALKTNIQFCGDDIKAVMFTSTIPDEGKSTVSFELARSLTESGKSVLFIDTDMRKSVLTARLSAKTTNGSAIKGLSHYLSGQCNRDQAVYDTNIQGLFCMLAGPSVPNPTEILDKPRFEQLIVWGKENYDYVILDCSPVEVAIDATVVSKYVDGAIMVIAQGMAGSRMIQDAVKQLKASNVRILGAVLNKVKMDKKTYGGYRGKYYGRYSKYSKYGKYGYGYGYGSYYDNPSEETKK